MRQIRYRVWYDTVGDFLEGEMVRLAPEGSLQLWDDEYKEWIEAPEPHRVSVELYTGLLDNEGSGLFEADVLRDSTPESPVVNYLLTLFWSDDDGGFIYLDGNGIHYPVQDFTTDFLTKVGTLHDEEFQTFREIVRLRETPFVHRALRFAMHH